MNAQDIMTANPSSVTAETSIAEAAEILSSLDVRHLPVVRGNEVVGILSDRDLRSIGMPRLLDDERLDRLRERTLAPVSTIMNPDVVTVYPETDVHEVIDQLLEYKIGAAPVVDPATGDLMGIVSYIDVLRAIRPLLEEA